MPGPDPGSRAPSAKVRLFSTSSPDDHRDRARRDVVVVPARVVLRGPAEQPDVDVGVAVERDVDPRPRRRRPTRSAHGPRDARRRGRQHLQLAPAVRSPARRYAVASGRSRRSARERPCLLTSPVADGRRRAGRRRVGHADRMGGGVAEQRPHRLAVRAVGAEHQGVDPEHPDQRVEGARTVAGRVDVTATGRRASPLATAQRRAARGAPARGRRRRRTPPAAAGTRRGRRTAASAHQAACSWPA